MKKALAITASFVSAALLQAADVTVSSNIDQDTRWTSDNVYILDGIINVIDGAYLTIDPGTVIKGKQGTGADASALVITRGAKIFAVGTPSRPIIFTSELDDLDGSLGTLDTGLWGGLIVLGNARINSAKDGEGTYPNIVDNVEGLNNSPDDDFTEFGGTDNGDSSGIIRYVSIRFGGTVLENNNEINGLTLAGVGSGTIVEFVEVFSNKDDGFEWFGGTVNARYLVAAFGNDDAFDYDTGWTGKGQFWASFGTLGPGDAADHGGEHDGTVELNTLVAEQRGMGEVFNATYIGPGSSGVGIPDEGAFEISDDAGARYYNSIFMSYGSHGIDIKDDAEIGLTTDHGDGRNRIDYRNNIWADFGAGSTPEALSNTTAGQILFSDAARANTTSDPMLRSIDRGQNGLLDPRPAADSPALMNERFAFTDPWYLAAPYQGAFSRTTNWMHGWTYLSEGGYLVEENSAASSSPINVSTRQDIAAGGEVTAGFIVQGELPKAVLIRAVGAALGPLGVTNAASDTTFTLYNNGVEIATVDDVENTNLIDGIGASVGAFNLGADTSSAAGYFILRPGVSNQYTVVAKHKDGATANVLIEIYDVDK